MPARTSPNTTTARISVEHATLHLTDGTTLPLSDAEARAWLASARHFYVAHPRGGYAARKDSRARGVAYWSAFRRHQGVTHRAYLGKTEQVTIERLRQVGDDLAAAVVEEGVVHLPGPQPHPRVATEIVVADVRFDAERVWLELTDGRVIGAPLAWFPRLAAAPAEARAAWTVAGAGVHWPALDEDISARVLMGLPS